MFNLYLAIAYGIRPEIEIGYIYNVIKNAIWKHIYRE